MKKAFIGFLFSIGLMNQAHADDTTLKNNYIERALRGIFIECLSRSENLPTTSPQTCEDEVRKMSKHFNQLESNAAQNLNQDLSDQITDISNRFSSIEGIITKNSEVLSQIQSQLQQLSTSLPKGEKP